MMMMMIESLIIEADYTAAAAQERQEESRGNPIDKVEHPEDCAKTEVTRLAEKDEAVFEEMLLPGYPKGERERREQWLTHPRRTRIAIRRMHDAFGHPVKSALINLLRAAKQPPEMINNTDTYKTLTGNFVSYTISGAPIWGTRVEHRPMAALWALLSLPIVDQWTDTCHYTLARLHGHLSLHACYEENGGGGGWE